MSLAVKHNGVFVTWLITKYDWSRKACLRTSSVMPPLPSLYYEYSPILLPPNRGASLFFIRSRRSRLESPRSMRNSALSTYSSVLSSKAQTSGFSCLNNSTICLSRLCVGSVRRDDLTCQKCKEGPLPSPCRDCASDIRRRQRAGHRHRAGKEPTTSNHVLRGAP